MGDFDLSRLERIVRSEIAAAAQRPAPETHGARFREMGRLAEPSGRAATRALLRLERAARRVLREIRKLRRAG